MKTIHIVEDDDAVLDAMGEVFRALGHKVLSHPSAESFLNATHPHSKDVVLIDLGLPGLSGQEVIRSLHELETPPAMVVISGRPLADINQATSTWPHVPVLRKPVTAEALTACV